MYRNLKVIAIIPARKGSKRLPNKNILPLHGKPVIAWTIEAALASKYIDEVVVSTDSGTIMNIAKQYGASVPFLRPESLSDDMATTDDVMMHAIKSLQLSSSDIVVLLQPTSPLRNSFDIDNALDELKFENVKGVVSVCKCEHSPLWSNSLGEDCSMGNFIKPEVASKRSQDLPIYYRLNGAIYAYKVSFFNKHEGRHYSSEVKAYIMPNERSTDIDNEYDFFLSERLIEFSKK